MNIDNGNYAKELAKAREDFNSTTKKLKENYDKNIKDGYKGPRFEYIG
jgi:hypothetical protein